MLSLGSWWLEGNREGPEHASGPLGSTNNYFFVGSRLLWYELPKLGSSESPTLLQAAWPKAQTPKEAV
jgi:hypothetical protein